MRVVVVGTGTGVGKTHVGCSLLEAWAERGIEGAGLKPVETGLVETAGGSDQECLLAAGGSFHVKRELGAFHVKRPLYGFADPISPHLAARIAGERIDLAAIRQWVAAHAAAATLIETAGGLFSPLSDGATNLDLAAALAPALVLLIAPDRLGVLHDLTATLGLAKARAFRIDGVVLSTPNETDASTGRNATELARLSITRPIAVFPRADPRDPATRAAASLVLDWAERVWPRS
jgi:dethiobiotin synthetase